MSADSHLITYQNTDSSSGKGRFLLDQESRQEKGRTLWKVPWRVDCWAPAEQRVSRMTVGPYSSGFSGPSSATINTISTTTTDTSASTAVAIIIFMVMPSLGGSEAIQGRHQIPSSLPLISCGEHNHDRVLGPEFWCLASLSHPHLPARNSGSGALRLTRHRPCRSRRRRRDRHLPL